MENGTEQYYDNQSVYAADEPMYAADQPMYAADQPMYAADQPMYAADQPMYAADQPMYAADQPMYAADQPMYAADQPMYAADQPMYASDRYSVANEQQTELPPEPEDSPYEDPVVRHILSIKDEKYRQRMLTYLNEHATPKKDLHPAIILTTLLVCFPVGLGLMYFGTRWGTFAKVVITIFVLLTALALYEILVLGDILPTPSLIGTIGYIFQQLTAGAQAGAETVQ